MSTLVKITTVIKPNIHTYRIARQSLLNNHTYQYICHDGNCIHFLQTFVTFTLFGRSTYTTTLYFLLFINLLVMTICPTFVHTLGIHLFYNRYHYSTRLLYTEPFIIRKFITVLIFMLYRGFIKLFQTKYLLS